MEQLKEKVERILAAQYPGSRLFWEDESGLSRLGGTLTWAGFAEKTQLERQQELGRFLREQLRDQATSLGIIAALTPQERDALIQAA